MFVNHKRSSSNLRSQTIIIEAEDSLLEQSQIKQFINKNINFQAGNVNNICYNDEYVQTLGSTDSQNNNCQKNNLKSSKDIFNSQKTKYSNISHTNFMKTANQFNSTIKSSLSLQSNKASQINPFFNTQSCINPQKSAFKVRSALNLNRKEKIENLIQNKKLWSLKLLAKNQSLFSLKNKQRFSPNNNSQLKKDEKTNSLLKAVETSTWLGLNPEKMKKSLIILSKNDKITRAQIFNSKQASKTLNNNIKQVNKIVFNFENHQSLQKNNKNILVKPILALSSLRNFKTQKEKFQLDKILQSKGLKFKNPFRKIVSRHQYIQNIQSQYI